MAVVTAPRYSGGVSAAAIDTGGASSSSDSSEVAATVTRVLAAEGAVTVKAAPSTLSP